MIRKRPLGKIFHCSWRRDLLLVFFFGLHSPIDAAKSVHFVKNGKPLLVREEGESWTPTQKALRLGGVGNILWAGQTLGKGDFQVKARLSIEKLSKSAASFCMDKKSHFGFEGAGEEIFLSGPIFGPSRTLGEPDPYIQEGKAFDFEVKRKDGRIEFLINGETVHTQRYDGFIGMIGFRPWRSTMSIESFSAEGDLHPCPPPRSQPTAYTLPLIDLSTEKHRQVVVARGTKDIYQGHPTTLLMPNGRTMFAVWTYDHGGRCGPMKRSEDGGLTWSQLLPVPENWSTVFNCPAIHRLTDPQGKSRLFVFAGNGDMFQSVSEDEGKTWSPMEPNGLHCVVVPITIEPIAGERLLALYHLRGAIMQSISRDGGLTWEEEREICRLPGTYPCEPAVIRSPDGKQLAALCRENNRVLNSLLITSEDEGTTWSDPRELPASLTGDRHLPRYAPDGRIVCPFRDMAEDSPTQGDFVAWIGTYEDIVNLREGQYRVRLLRSPKKRDLGYPGMEVLPSGTLVATTYAVLEEGEKNSVVSVRFTMEELDAKAKSLPDESAVFLSGKEGYHTFRIPSLLVTPKDTILSFCEGRKTGGGDHGDIDLVVKRSGDGGKSWGSLELVYEEGDDAPITIGNPCPVVDQRNGILWMAFCRNNEDIFIMKSEDDGRSWSPPQDLTQDVKPEGWGWVATGPGVGIQMQRGPHKGRLIIPCDHREKEDGAWIMHSHVFFSDDAGETWKLGGSAPKHTDECQVVELREGRLLLNMRNYWEKTGGEKDKGNRRALVWSEDGGESWKDLTFDAQLVEPICQGSFIRYDRGTPDEKSVLLFSNPASKERVEMTVKVSLDEGKTWPKSQVLWPGPSAYSCLARLPSGEIACLYEKGKEHPYETITFATFQLDWLEGQ